MFDRALNTSLVYIVKVLNKKVQYLDSYFDNLFRNQVILVGLLFVELISYEIREESVKLCNTCTLFSPFGSFYKLGENLSSVARQ